MSLEIGKRGVPVKSLQRNSSSVARTDGESPVSTTSPPPENYQATGLAAMTLGGLWDGLVNFAKGIFQAVVNFFGNPLASSSSKQLDEESAAIASAYNLLPTKENVQLFLEEAQSYEAEGAIGPDAPADSVKILQEALMSLGYALQASGDFDQATCTAVMDFKRSNGLHQSYRLVGGSYAVNEYVGKAALTVLQQKIAVAPLLPTITPTAPAASSNRTLMPVGSLERGNDAIIKQYDLLPTRDNVDAFLAETQAYSLDGTLGPGMEEPAAIKELQTILSSCGYRVKLNGIYDEATADAVLKFKKDVGLHENYKLSDGTFAVNQYAGPDALTRLLERAAGVNSGTPAKSQSSPNQLASISPADLAALGANDKKAFFDALRPAAEEAEKEYGVPAALTLAQAALESGWGKSAIGGYNIFGIKGSGPAGTVAKQTQEWDGSKYITITADFAKYNDFYEAVVEHGKLFHNGHYDKAVAQFAQDHDYRNFVANIQGIYATSPTYSTNILSIIDQYKLA